MECYIILFCEDLQIINNSVEKTPNEYSEMLENRSSVANQDNN